MAATTREGLSLAFGGPDGTKFRAAVATQLGEMHTRYLPIMWELVVRWYGEVVLEQQFQQEGAYLGTKWADIDEDYVARKAALGYYTQIGKATGDLWQACTSIHSDSDSDWRVTHGGWGVEMEIQLDYAEYFHEDSTFRDGRPNPARPIDGAEGEPPAEVLLQLGKIIGMVHALALRHATRAADDAGNVLRADGEAHPTAWLSEFPKGQIDAYIDELVEEVG